MPGQPVKLGPFIGGMNTYSGPSAISDNEAVEITNMDIDLDGSLASRPGLTSGSVPSGVTNSHLIGTYRSITDVLYVIYAFTGKVYAYNTSVGSWTLIANVDATTCEQYLDSLYIVIAPAGTAVGGGKWDPTSGYTAIAAMPRGNDSCIYKERMFISGSRNDTDTSVNRVKFSNPANPDTWTSTDYFDVSAGDGQDITALHVYEGQIVIFKTDSTFVYAYESQPAKGIVQIVSGAVGANNRFSVVEYENNLFVMHESRVYRIGNWNWEHANVKVPFAYVNKNGITVGYETSVSLIDNRLVCRYYDLYYVLGLKTGAWVKWEFGTIDRTPTEFVASPNVDAATGVRNHYAGSYNPSNPNSYQISSVVFNAGESFVIRFRSKAYDFGPSYGFKRLFWWGIDLLSYGVSSYKVSPLVYNTPVTWGQVGAVPISQLQTWGRPLDVTLDVTDSANTYNPSGYRTFIKLLKSLRFRQASFTIEATLAGTSTSPYRIFSLTAFVDSKEVVSKKVS